MSRFSFIANNIRKLIIPEYVGIYRLFISDTYGDYWFGILPVKFNWHPTRFCLLGIQGIKGEVFELRILFGIKFQFWKSYFTDKWELRIYFYSYKIL